MSWLVQDGGGNTTTGSVAISVPYGIPFEPNDLQSGEDTVLYVVFSPELNSARGRGSRDTSRMSDQSAPKRRFFHSFPRPKKDEPPHLVLARGLKILDLMKQVGLVLAPEVVSWDLSVIRPGGKPLGILQRRASFTELDVSELPGHSAVFGPISLSFDVAKLRDAGATPVIYVPQGTADTAH
jgi:hypothetical protein